jgi:hypothetical protein
MASPAFPDFGPTTHADRPPPPISGGTLLVTKDDRHAVASDPDHDQIAVADLGQFALVGVVALLPGEEPGRLAEDGAGHVHVALRRSGDILTIDPANASTVERRHVCGAPRGIAYDPGADALLVACAGGQLYSMPPSGGLPRLVLHDQDLRDVVVGKSMVFVSRFRAGEILRLPIDAVRTPGAGLTIDAVKLGPDMGVSWRMVQSPTDPNGVLVSHQQGSSKVVDTQIPSAYGGFGGGPCGVGGGLVTSMISEVHSAGYATSTGVPMAPLPVDIATLPNRVVRVAAAGGNAQGSIMGGVIEVGLDTDPSGCNTFHPVPTNGQVVAASASPTRFVTQTRNPWTIHAEALDGSTMGDVTIPGADVHDTGHDVFHLATLAGIACASCHPEGGDDGRVWTFDFGRRRTPSLHGTVAGTAPYHWSGDMQDIGMLASNVLTKRMSGPQLDDGQTNALRDWLFAIPAPAAEIPADAEAVARGEALFHSPGVGCSGCHSGEHFTNNTTVDVGTGGMFQVPSLIGVRARAPYLHTGCAATLTERFDPACGGSRHGNTANLALTDVADLVAYLGTL